MKALRALLFSITLAVCCTHAVLAAEPIKVAAVFSLSGIAASHNAPLATLAQLAASEINQNGGVLGRPLELILLDNQSTAIGSSLAAERACRLGAAAVIGAHWSSHSLAMAPILQKHGIPMITPASTHPDITKVGDYIFRICFVDSSQGRAMARFARESLRVRRVIILKNMDEAYSLALGDHFKEAFVQDGGTILLERGYRGKAIDFSDIIREMKSLAPEAVYLPGYTRDSGLLIKQAASNGLKTVFLGGDAWDEIHAVAGEALDGSFQSAPWHPRVPLARSRHLQKIHRDKFGQDIGNMSAPLAYDAVMLLNDAIRRAGGADPKQIRDALARTDAFEGATGVIAFDESRNPKHKDIILLRFDKDGPKYFMTLNY
ncbi:MAG: ABC transporter substrate-binding protein [Syntrophobacteraceae bacterium]|jgi:branched-chain amino acid transport system substrate-binding protein|nr:ABC transporter substrate-binding protein [Syntrophobacteraceae bacterium]